MRALDHRDITAAMLHASSVAEPDLACTHPWWATVGEKEWLIGTTYTGQDNYVIRSATHRVYRSLQTSTGKTPETEPLFWEDFGPTNRWAAFDMKSSTTLKGASPCTITLRPGVVTDVDIGGLDNVLSAQLQIWDSPGGSLIHDETVSTLWWGGDPWVSYYFDLPYQRRRVKFTGLPVGEAAELLLTLISIDGGEAGISQVAAGRYIELGCPEYGFEMRLRNFGLIEEDEWGNTRLKEGLVVRDLVGSDVVPVLDANRVAEFGLKNRNRVLVWEAVDSPEYDYLSTTGIANISVRAEGPALARMNIEIQGVGA